MKCPVCGEAELLHDIRDLPYTYKGETTLILAGKNPPHKGYPVQPRSFDTKARNPSEFN